ncbi:MAG: D-hexose-6-phosphate mutarotase, partial [Nitrosomonas sp.]|nr:D-hexose-6-phosphate mutarotase [Nitrosomonas sp.]
DDKALDRCIQILSQGNKTAVVWNPWEKIAREMADLEDTDYQHVICVETTNAADDVIGVAPGGEFRLVADYRVMK